MYLIVGLGNPGSKYELTRHNAGFLVIDKLAQSLNLPINKIKFKSLYNETRIGNEKCIIMKPQTFMNLSGESVKACMDYYNIPNSNLIVIYDDKDTDFGKLRLRIKGSAGSHNGMKNIIYLLNSDEFPRIRIGIGDKTQKSLADFVLSKFTQDEMAMLPDILDKSVNAVTEILHSGMDIAMNKYNKNE